MQPAPAWPRCAEAVWAQHTRLHGTASLACVCQQQGPRPHRVPGQQASIKHSSIRHHPLRRPHSECLGGAKYSVTVLTAPAPAAACGLVGCNKLATIRLAGCRTTHPKIPPLLRVCPATAQVTPGRYMEAICAMQPDMFVPLADEVRLGGPNRQGCLI